MNFFEIGYENIIEIVLANSSYEAYGFFVIEHASTIECVEDVEVRDTYTYDHQIEVSCIGIPQYKTLKELYEEKTNPQVPMVICSVTP
ncbi:hypothetical protein PP175_28720 (plasmid) [Aneurinibacillus sp. Ricciae_BoGa-3]|uniref:hypothetical protein n=1 Tax=Aneurinibacillus sp. Ricciae_BoGa-3 TaxID=3022697 RepID=UPI00233FA650|nr:hypothetical protein [Aneurinibacillus sp. Ricciae_BoGa-3]WCK57174.1 hypothetical protein PP175_28720 [Aneurinibacillus sp. Ricciae_BoGa-3]